MNKEDILKKPEAERTPEEIAFLETGKDTMNEDEAKSLVTKTAEEAMTKAIEKLSDGLIAKFMDGVKESRAEALKSGEQKGKGQENTRAFMKALLAGDKAGAKALSTDDTETDGAGLLIPAELRNEVLRIAQTQFGLARRDMFYLPFSGPGNTRTVPTLGTSVQVFWTGEGQKKRSTQPKFSLVTQTLKKLAAIVPMTEEILEDSIIDINALLGQLFAEAIAKEEDVQFFMGTGNPWTGILNLGTVNKVNSAGDVSQTTVDDLIDMEDATPTGALNGAKYYFHRTILSVLRKLKDKNGNYILVAAADGKPGTLNGYPYETSDAFPAKSDVTTGDPYILFGNLKQGAIFGDKQQIRVKLLDQATVGDSDNESGSGEGTSINLAEQDMVALRVVERVGYTPALVQAMTVLKASATEI